MTHLDRVRTNTTLQLATLTNSQHNRLHLDADLKGDAYEGLLQKGAEDTKSGAGQYFTPRPLVRAMMACLRPKPGERSPCSSPRRCEG